MKKLTSLMLCIMMMLALVLSASAFELDVAENDVIETVEEAVLEADTLSIPLEDENYGKLILFKDFEQENATNKSYAYMDTNYMSSNSVTHASASSTVVDNPVEGEDGKVLEVTGTGWAQFFVTFGGLSVGMQQQIFMQSFQIKFRTYLAYKTTHAILACALLALYLLFLN